MNTNIIEVSASGSKYSGFSSLCLLFILMAMTLNDLPLQQFLGTLGASPMWAVSLIMFALFVIGNKFHLYLDKYSRLFIVYFLLTFSISFIQCIYYYFAKGTMLNSYGASVLNKHFFASSYYLFYFLTIYCACYALLSVSWGFLAKSIILIAFFLTTIIAVESVMPNVLAPFHLSMEGYEVGSRLRVLSPEPSIAAFTFNIFLLLAITLSNVSMVRLILWSALLIGNLLIGSKSSLMLMMLGAFLVFYFNMTLMQKLKSLIVLVPVTGVMLYILLNKVLPAFAVDIENFTSVSTRLITSLWSIFSLFYYPLGEGYGNYTAWYATPLEVATAFANSFVPFSLNMTEITEMVATGKYLTAKSGILFSVIQSGFFAVFFYSILYRNAFKDIQSSNATYYQKIMIRVTLWYSLLSILLAVNMEVLYTFLLPFIVVNYIKKNS